MEVINLANCCYPVEQHLTYKIKVRYSTVDGWGRKRLMIKVGPGQNVEMVASGHLATIVPNPIAMIIYESIKLQ